MNLKNAESVDEIVEPDQIPYFAGSDLNRHCLLKPICPNTQS